MPDGTASPTKSGIDCSGCLVSCCRDGVVSPGRGNVGHGRDGVGHGPFCPRKTRVFVYGV